MRWAWEADAACRGAQVDLWFLDSHENATAAKKVCRACPVRTDCLEANLGQKDGIFGGLSPVERTRERKRRRNMEAAA